MLTRNANNVYAAYKTEEQDRQEDPEEKISMKIMRIWVYKLIIVLLWPPINYS